MRTLFYLALAALMTAILSGCLVAESTYLMKVTELDALTEEQAELQNRQKALRAENVNLKAALAKLESDHDSLKEVKVRLDESVTKLVNDNNNLEMDLQSSGGATQQRIAELRRKITAVEGENRRLRQEIADLQTAKKAVHKAGKAYGQLLDKMQSELARGQVTIAELPGKLTVTLPDALLFDPGRADLTEHGLTFLHKVADILTTVKDKTLRIEGHTDNAPIRGALINKYATNWELSAARAISVTRFFQDQGVEPALLVAAAYGEHRPVAPNDSAEGKAKNRRIEIILVPKEE